MNEYKDLASRLSAVINTAIDGIITIDKKGIIESINNAGCEIFQYEEKELIGQNINMLMPPPDKEQHDEYLQRYHQTNKPHIIGIGREVMGLKKDGTIFPFRLAVSKVDLENRIIFTGIIHDLTNIKAAEERIIKLNRELEQKVAERTYQLEDVVNKLLVTNRQLEDEIQERTAIEAKLISQEEELRISLLKEKELGELKSRFVSMASHEFRTPLATILSSAALIKRYINSEQQDRREKHVDRIKSAVANLTGILNDFLSISKLEEGKVDLKISEFYMEEVIEEVSNDVEGLLKNEQIIVAHYYGNKQILKTDKRIIKNILFNLVSNAIKYSNEKSTIECNIQYNAEEFEIEIKDYGIGIPEEDQKHMFQRFFRAGNVINIQGTGLGLIIVKRYLDILNGKIRFISKYGIGTSFFVSLPYTTDDNEENINYRR